MTELAKSNGLLGVGEAAEILGVSRTSLQRLVDTGRIAAIKTSGGHRRIERSAVMALRDRLATTVPAAGHALYTMTHPGRRKIEILIVDDDEVAIEFVVGLVTRKLPESVCTVARDGFEAVLQLERRRPDVVITDLCMTPFDGFGLARLIHTKAEYRDVCVLAITALSDEEIRERGGLPADVLLYKKPMSPERLMGYLEAHLQAMRKHCEGSRR